MTHNERMAKAREWLVKNSTLLETACATGWRIDAVVVDKEGNEAFLGSPCAMGCVSSLAELLASTEKAAQTKESK